jgi:hypothetical protein
MSGRPRRRFCRRCGAEIATANLIDIDPGIAIRMITTSRGTSHLKCGTLVEAQRSARDAAAITGCQVEILIAERVMSSNCARRQLPSDPRMAPCQPVSRRLGPAHSEEKEPGLRDGATLSPLSARGSHPWR